MIEVDDYLGAVEAQLAELTERRAHRRLRARLPLPSRGGAFSGRRGVRAPRGRGPRPRSDLFAVGAAALVTAAVVAIILTAGAGSRHPGAASRTGHHGPPTAPAHHGSPHGGSSSQPGHSHGGASGAGGPAGPVPADFAPQSFTAISELTWWLLGNAPCSSAPCTSIVRTDDGGRTFVGIPAPRTSAVSQLRFADAQNGFAYGPQLWVTHDAGASWNPIEGLGGSVNDLAISDGYAYAIVTSSGGTGRLIRSPVAENAWTTLPAAGDAYSGLWAQGSGVLLESSTSSRQQLMVSSDQGATFTAHAPPPNVSCEFQEPTPPVLWAHCATGMMSGVWRSTDSGQTFEPAQGAHSWPGPELPNSAAFAAASASTAVVGYQQLYRTTDGGASWTPVAGPTGITFWQYVGFTDQTHGVALGLAGSQARLYYTTDGGVSYHLVTIG